jgi:hypothetical protein
VDLGQILQKETVDILLAFPEDSGSQRAYFLQYGCWVVAAKIGIDSAAKVVDKKLVKANHLFRKVFYRED